VSFHGPEESAKLLENLERRKEKADSPVEEAAIKEQMAAIDRFFGKKIDATYKIEIQFGPNRSMWKPFGGMMSIFLSGTKLHGGGDEKVYICPKEGCNGIVHPQDRLGASVVCKKCQMTWPETQLVGELFFVLTAQKWAEVLERWFMVLESKADIYLKYHRMDIRTQAAIEQERQKGGEFLNKARNVRGMHVYPLHNIIKDTSNGASVRERFLAFVRA